jgi:hypothetical protein
MTKLKLPHLDCPFPEKANPHTERAQRHLVEWVRSHRMITDTASLDRYGRARFAEIVGRSYPRAGAEDLELLSDVWGWIWVLDDRVCGDAPIGQGLTAEMALLPQLSDILEAPEAEAAAGANQGADSPIVAGFADLCRRLLGRGGAERFSRFREAMYRLLVGIAWEVDHRRTSTLPTVAEVLPMRRHGGAAPVAIALIEIGDDLALPAAEFERAEVRSLRRHMANILCWMNDVCSYAREASEQEGLLVSLPWVLTRHSGLSAQQALEEVANRHNAEIAEYLALEAGVSRGAGLDLRAFLGGMRSLIRGAYDWHLNTPRYAVSTHFN